MKPLEWKAKEWFLAYRKPPIAPPEQGRGREGWIMTSARSAVDALKDVTFS